MSAFRICVGSMLVGLLFAACTKKASSTSSAPEVFKAIPAGADILVHQDVKAWIKAYHRIMKELGDFIPPEVKKDIPSWDEIVAKLKEPTGIDLNKLETLTVAIYAGSPTGSEPQFVAIISGQKSGDINGSSVSEYQGVKLFSFEVEKSVHYAQLDPSHLAVANTKEKLQQVIDTQAGRKTSLLGNNKLLDTLLAEDPQRDHLRVYLVGSKLIPMGRLPVRVEGGGFFMHVDKGLSVVALSDEEGAGTLKQMVGSALDQFKGMMAKQKTLAMQGQDQEVARKMWEQVDGFVNSIQVKQTGGKLVVSSGADQPPMLTIGVLAAVGIPAFIEYIRKSKVSEVYMHLDRCYMGVVDYYDRERVNPDGTLTSNELPPPMKEAICPKGRTIETLNGESESFDPSVFEKGGKGETFKSIGFVIQDYSYACYQYTVDVNGKDFTCHAWTNIDEDGKPAHWVKKATFEATTNSFRAGPAVLEAGSDNY